MPPRRPAGHHLDDPCHEPDRRADLPRVVVGAGQVEDQSAAPSAERRAELVHHERHAKQRREITRAERIGNDAADQEEAGCGKDEPANNSVLVGVGGSTK